MKKLPFSILSSTEIYSVTNRIAEACKLAVKDNEYIKELCELLIEGNNNLRKGLGRTFNSEFTSVLLHYDELRVNAFIGMRDYIHACCNNGDEIKEKAASYLSSILEAVGNTLYSLPYSEESTKLDLLFEKFDASAAREAIATINATDWLERLKTRQADFEKVYHSKVETEAGIDFPLLKTSKNTIKFYLKGLLNYIETNSKKDTARFSSLEDQINEIITDIVTLARARGTRKENAEKKTNKKPA